MHSSVCLCRYVYRTHFSYSTFPGENGLNETLIRTLEAETDTIYNQNNVGTGVSVFNLQDNFPPSNTWCAA